jgi:hypothetical protein
MSDKPNFREIREVRRRAIKVMFHIAYNGPDNDPTEFHEFPSDPEKAGTKIPKGSVKAMVFFLDDQESAFQNYERTLVLPEKNTGRFVNYTIGRFLQQYGLKVDQRILRKPSYTTYSLTTRPRKKKVQSKTPITG